MRSLPRSPVVILNGLLHAMACGREYEAMHLADELRQCSADAGAIGFVKAVLARDQTEIRLCARQTPNLQRDVARLLPAELGALICGDTV